MDLHPAWQLRHALEQPAASPIQPALAENEDWHRDLVEHSQDLLCIHDLNGRLLAINPAPARVLGYTVEELLRVPMWDLIPPEFQPQFDAYLSQVARTGEAHGLMAVLSPSGERRIWEYRNTLRTEGVSSPIVRGMAHDVTEQKRYEHALRRREADLNLAQAVAHLGSWRYDIQKKFVTLSDETFRILGLPPGTSLPADSAVSFVHPDDREQVRQAWAGALSGGGYDIEIRIVVGGRTRWLRVQAGLEFDTHRRPLAAVGTVQDITEHKLSEERLREYERALEGMEEMIVVVDRNYRYIVANRAFLNFRRMRKEQVLGHTIGEVLDPSVFESTVKPKLDACFDGNVVNYEICYNYPESGERDLFVSYFPIEGPDGVERVACILKDITARKQAEEALRRSEENYRMFVAQSSEGIFRQDVDAPISIDLPEDELIRRIFNDSYLAQCNDALARMYGLSSVDGFLGKRLTDTVDPRDPRNIELTREFIRSGFRVLERESHEVDIHGQPRVFLNSMIGIVENGHLVRTWGIQRDVTERVKLEAARSRAEEALRASEERFRVALKDSPVTVFNQDTELRYTWIYNPHLYLGKDTLGQTDDAMLGPESALPLNQIKRRVLETGTSLRQEVVIPVNGKSYSFDVTLEPLRDSTGQIIGITGAAVDIARLREMADRLQEQKEMLVQEKLYLEREIQSELGFEEIIGQSLALKNVLKQARVVAPTQATVLLLGETGTGKELVARSLHQLSARRDKNFIKLNCAAVPAGLLESELFGHEKGAFTGAVSLKLGRLELADKGTLFLDEIGELPLELQPKLLRVLQDQEFEHLGGVQTLRVDVRVVAATNRDLMQDVLDRSFREDLFYRLNVFPIRLPALRERRSDIPLLVHHFVRKHAARMNKRIETIPEETLQALTGSNWPGNIRELENLIERLVILARGPVLVLPPGELSALQGEQAYDGTLSGMEREHIIHALREANGVLSGPAGAAARLGLKRQTLQSMLKRFHIEAQEYRRRLSDSPPLE